MGLVQCPECKNQVSEFAKLCPQCGYEKGVTIQKPTIKEIKKSGAARIASEVEKKAYSTMGCLVWGFIFILAALLLGAFLKGLGL